MLFLLLDITTNLFYIGLAHRETTVPFLPSELFVFSECFVNPFRRIRLHFAKHVRYGHAGVNGGQQMNMVGRPASGEELSVLVLEYAADIVVEARPHFWSDLWRAVLGAEYQVVTKASERVAQDALLHSGCRPSGAPLSSTHASQGLTPLATDHSPAGAKRTTYHSIPGIHASAFSPHINIRP